MNKNTILLLSVSFLIFFIIPSGVQTAVYAMINEPDMNNMSSIGAGVDPFLDFHETRDTLAAGNDSDKSKDTGTLLLITDKSDYLPGQTVKISGHTDTVIQFEGLKFQITDPSDKVIASGTLYPIDGKFSTTAFMTTVNPVYGTYVITGTYLDQSSSATFELIADVKEDVPISLHTDKEVYGLGQTVTITGRLNTLWVDTLDLEILQTKNIALHNTGGQNLKILDAVRISGDGRFEYVFAIPDGPDRLGDYRIKVSKDIGSATKSFTVAADPAQYVADDKPLVLFTDRTSYALGEKIIIDGKIANPESSDFDTLAVTLTVMPQGTTQSLADMLNGMKFTTVPDQSGRFSFEVFIASNVFAPGVHTIKAAYGDLSESSTVNIIGASEPLDYFVSIDKDVYGLADTVHLTGTLPPRAENTVSISITTPDGSIINSGTRLDNQKFSWEWNTPVFKEVVPIKNANDRTLFKSNIGIYKLDVSSGTFSQSLLFKVSENPDDSLVREKLVINSNKPSYVPGQTMKVSGFVSAREHGAEDLFVPDRVRISVQPAQFIFPNICDEHVYSEQDDDSVLHPLKRIWTGYCAFVYPTQGGYFESDFDLIASLFDEGQYKIKATYLNFRAESTFDVAKDLTESEEDVTLLISSDRQSYNPGQLATITGKTSKLVHLDELDIRVIKESENSTMCGPLVCGIQAEPLARIALSPLGSFTYEFQIDDAPSAIGTYEIIAEAEFDVKSVTFDVSEPADVVHAITVISEKVNRISASEINITAAPKLSKDNLLMLPHAISGSLTALPSDQSAVNLMVSSELGTCIVGPAPDCMVRDSTATPDTMYYTITVDGITLNVHYSGPDVRLERFEITAQDPAAYLTMSDWKVKILKDDQASRFYYKVNYHIIR